MPYEMIDLSFVVLEIYMLYSRNVNKFVCSMFIARVASYASMTQEMLISLAPVSC